MSYLGRVFDRSSRASIGLIWAFDSPAPSAYSPVSTSTVGGCPFRRIRRAYPRIIPRHDSGPMPRFSSNADQHRSTGVSLGELQQVAAAQGLTAHLAGGHYVVLYTGGPRGVVVGDPTLSVRTLPVAAFLASRVHSVLVSFAPGAAGRQ